MAKLGLLILSEEPHDMEHVRDTFLKALEAITGGPVDLSPRPPTTPTTPTEPTVPPPPPPPPLPGGKWERIVPGGQGVWYSGGTHGGYPAADIFAPKGSRIIAPHPGTMRAYWTPLGGHSGTFHSDAGNWYYLAHANQAFVDGHYNRGVVMGYVGDSGNAAGGPPHLHLAVASRESVFSERNGSGEFTEDFS